MQDNRKTDVRIESRIQFYGPVFVFIGTPLVLIVLSVYLIFMLTHWHEFVGISGWIVKGVLIFLAASGGLTLIWLAGKAAGPFIGVYQRWAEARGQRMRNKVLYTSTNYAIVEHRGEARLIPVSIEKYNYSIRQVAPPNGQRALAQPREEEVEEGNFAEEEVTDEEYVPDIPARVAYEDVRHAVPQGQALLGVGAYGVETCDFGKLMTCWIVGGSSTGKSNTVALKIDEAIRLGRRIRLLVIDPHARKPDSLYNRIKCYEHLFVRPVASSAEDIYAILQCFLEEFDHRLEVGKGDYDLLLVVDEVSNVVEIENPYAETKEQIGDIARMLKKIARICGQEARGFGMFGWFISQKAAGLSWLRNVVITVIAHKMNMWSERILACNQNKAIAHDMGSWPVGRTLVYGLGFEEELVLQQPIFSLPSPQKKYQEWDEEEDVVDAVPAEPEQFFSAKTSPITGTAVPVGAHEEQPVEPRNAVPERERQRIIELAEAHIPRREICKHMGKGKWFYDVVKQVLDEEGL